MSDDIQNLLDKQANEISDLKAALWQVWEQVKNASDTSECSMCYEVLLIAEEALWRKDERDDG